MNSDKDKPLRALENLSQYGLKPGEWVGEKYSAKTCPLNYAAFWRLWRQLAGLRHLSLVTKRTKDK